jgi:hypothetical protein
LGLSAQTVFLEFLNGQRNEKEPKPFENYYFISHRSPAADEVTPEQKWESEVHRAKAMGIALTKLEPIIGERWFGGVVQKGVNPTPMCVNPPPLCVNPPPLCVNPPPLCVNPPPLCVIPPTLCVNPPRLCVIPPTLCVIP